MAKPEEFHWDEILKDTDIFYFSGVTPAVSENIAKAVLEALKYCKAHGIETVCDLNYRSKMWDTKGTVSYERADELCNIMHCQ